MEQKSKLDSTRQNSLVNDYPKQKECLYEAFVISHGILLHIREGNEEGSWPCLEDSVVGTKYMGGVGSE